MKIENMTEERDYQNEHDGLFSKAVKAGKRTYFFDVKETKGEDKYITITESKRRFDNELNRFFYEKHKIFLYKEDFEKVSKALGDAINFIATGEYPADYHEEEEKHFNADVDSTDKSVDKWFEDLNKPIE